MVEIIVTSEAGRIVYTVDMARDVISGIEFGDNPSTGSGHGGEIKFEYLMEVEGKEWLFTEPRGNRDNWNHGLTRIFAD
jgi:hypothetical protein